MRVARKRSWQFLAQGTFLEKGAWRANLFGWERRPRSCRRPSLSLEKMKCCVRYTRNFRCPTVSSPTCWHETFELRLTWSINSSTRPRRDWPAHFCCLLAMEGKSPSEYFKRYL